MRVFMPAVNSWVEFDYSMDGSVGERRWIDVERRPVVGVARPER